MADKWVVDEEHPDGHLVPMTPEEEAQLATDQAAAAAQAAAEAERAENANTIRETLDTRIGQLRTARTALAGGTIFAGLSANEKAVIDGLLSDNVWLCRLLLSRLDGTD